MEERRQIPSERIGGGPSGLDDPFSAGADEFGGMANVNGEDVPVSGMTLGEIRQRLADRFRIEPGSTTHVDGELIDDENRVVRAGERIEFLRHAGEKGLACSERSRRVGIVAGSTFPDQLSRGAERSFRGNRQTRRRKV
ncbi:MAG: hypothetical protein RIC12_01500 [Pirellulales bacterium]